MTLQKNTIRALVISIVTLLSASSAFLVYNSLRLAKKLDQERLEKESLLSEKIHLSRSMEEIRKELSAVSEKNHELTIMLEANHHQSNDR